MSIHVRISPEIRPVFRLNPCDNTRDFLGMPVPCPDGCAAHFDAWASPKDGIAYTSFPNSVLSWTAYLRYSWLRGAWASERHACGMRNDIYIRHYANRGDFLDPAGEPVPVWIVVVDGSPDDSHYVALFKKQADAESFYRGEIADLTNDCDCPPRQPRRESGLMKWPR